MELGEPAPGNKVVGVAMLPKKAAKHLRSGLIRHAAMAGITIQRIQPSLPLLEQGCFDIILHKIRNNPGFERELQLYQASHPDVLVLDAVEAIRPLSNRSTMLHPLQNGGLCIQGPSDDAIKAPPVQCLAPRQAVLSQGCSLDQAHGIRAEHGLSYPLLVKTLWSDGTPHCHAVGAVHDEGGLASLVEGQGVASGLQLPVVLQQYVPHGARLFKVYVLGSQVEMVKRDSLDLHDEQQVQQLQQPRCSTAGDDAEVPTSSTSNIAQGLQAMPRVSAYSCAQWGSIDTTHHPSPVPDPPSWLIKELAAQLRGRLGLQLFNFDLIIPWPQVTQQQHSARPKLVYVIDINYFPGYEKLPGYEELMVKFLQAQLEQQQQRQRQQHQ